MATNQFESNRISEGTMHAGAQHIRPAADPDVAEANDVYSIEEGKLPVPEPRQLLSAASLEGYDVKNSWGEDLGKVAEILLDAAEGQIAYVVFSVGGFLGMNNRFFAVPWSALRVDEGAHKLLLDSTRDDLQHKLMFESVDEARRDLASPAFGRLVHSGHGALPYWESTETEFGGDEYSANRSRHQ